MSSLALSLPTPSLVAADLLRLRKRGGLVVVTAVLTIGAVVLISAVNELLHVVDSGTYGPAGGVTMLGHVVFVVSTLGAVAAAIVGSTAGAGDHEAFVYREIVVTGRSRLALYLARIPAGLGFLFPFVAVAYAIPAVTAVVLAGTNPLPTVHVMTVAGLWVLLQASFYYLLACAIASLLGSRAYTIGIVLAGRLVLTPLIASIRPFGVVRELMPGIAIDRLAPATLAPTVTRLDGTIPMSLAAMAAVLIGWTAVALVAGAWRDTTRDA